MPLAVGAGLAVLLTVAGVVLTTRSAGPLRVMADPAVRRRYSIIVGLEFGLLGAGAAVLGATGQARWIPAWICAGVGVHFFPLASTLANRSLRLLGVLLIGVATAALATGLASATAPSTITRAGAGLCLLAFGLATLLQSLTTQPRRYECGVLPNLAGGLACLDLEDEVSYGREGEVWAVAEDGVASAGKRHQAGGLRRQPAG